MFAPKLAPPKATTRSTSRLAPKRFTRLGFAPTGTTVGDDHEQECARESMTVREASPGAAWDFSKIPLFPPDRASLAPGRSWDRVADHVIGKPAPPSPLTSAPTQLSRKCAACEEERALQSPQEETPGGTSTQTIGAEAGAAVGGDAASTGLAGAAAGGTPVSAPVLQPAGSKFGLDVQPPVGVQDPTMPPLGVYKVDPADAVMDYSVNATVNFPSGGNWEVGLVQNVEVVRYVESRSAGGQISVFVGVPLLDQNPDTGDIWLGDPQTFSGVTAGQTLTVSLTPVDTPITPAIPGQRTRCNGKIAENLKSVVNSTFFRAALVARQGSALFQLAASEAPYGFTWAFTVQPDGKADNPPAFEFSPKPPGLAMKLPPFKPLVITPPAAAGFIAPIEATARAKYAQDCTQP